MVLKDSFYPLEISLCGRSFLFVKSKSEIDGDRPERTLMLWIYHGSISVYTVDV